MERATVNANGFSLVELLAALALGLFVLAGAAALFADSGRHNAVLHARARLNDNARFALQFLSRDLRLAGFGCAAGSPALAAVAKNKFRGDTVAVNYALFAEGEAAHALQLDCAAAAPPAKLRRREYRVDRDSAGMSVLYVREWDAARARYKLSEPLLEGVDYLRVLYGLDGDGDGGVDRYSEDITAGATVRAVRIALLVRSLSSARVAGNPHREYGALPVDTATYNVLDRTVNPRDLRVMRRVAGATVKLRNR